MSPTFTSETVAEIAGLSLHFDLPAFQTWSLRDSFVGLLSRKPTARSRRLTVLSNVSFTIQQGDRIGLLGVNGAGKSSLCRCLAGTYIPSHGQVKLSGRVRGIFDTAMGIYPELTGRENARLLMWFLYPDRPDEHETMLEEALEFSQLGEFLDAPYRVYSNGMQARLCLSLVSCRPAELLILDEVFDGADQFFRERIAKRVQDMIRASGAVIFVSHSLEQIRQVCNRTIILHGNRIAFQGAVEPGINRYLELAGGIPQKTPMPPPTTDAQL
jgi:ABC-type polysaccharide/polyol phosphate transport system ATPase subunit